MDNLKEMDKFLEMFNLPRLNWEETEIMNNPITQRPGLRGALPSPPRPTRVQEGERPAGCCPEPAGPVVTGEGVCTAAGLSPWPR